MYLTLKLCACIFFQKLEDFYGIDLIKAAHGRIMYGILKGRQNLNLQKRETKMGFIGLVGKENTFCWVDA